MSKKNKYLGLLLVIVIVALGAFNQTIGLKADTPSPRIIDSEETPWVSGLTALGGKLKYGFTPNRNGTNSTPNVEYVPDLKKPEEVIRHLYDWRAYNAYGIAMPSTAESHVIGSTVPLNIIENETEYLMGRTSAGVVTINDVVSGGNPKEIIGTGGKSTDSGLAVSASMKANNDNTAVEHVYTITNNTGVTKVIYPHKSVDTQLNYDDYVPVYSRGKGKGIYIEGKLPEDVPNRPDYKSYRLDYTTNVENGPKYYVASVLGSRFSDDGTTVEDRPERNAFGLDLDNQYTPYVEGQMTADAGTKLYPTGSEKIENTDTAFFMSWGKVELKPNETFTMRYDVGIRPLAELTKTKTAENLTSKDGKNRVGDEIEYTISMESPELSYYNLVVTDELSEAFEHPTKDVTVTDVTGINGNKTSFPITEVYNPATRTLTIPTIGDGLKLVKKGKIEIKFRVKLGANAAGKQITNSADVTGKTEEETDIDEKVVTEDPLPVENTGRVIIKYQDEAGNEIHLSDSIIDIVDEDYDAKKKKIEINGYKFKEAKGDPETGKITLADKEVIYIYSENRFTIKQEVKDAKGDDAHNAAVDMGDVLTYTTTLTSLLKQDQTPGADIVYYDGFTMVANVSEYLTNIEPPKLVSTNGVELPGIYDSGTNTITVTINKNDGITSDEQLVLTYKGTVKDVSDVDIKAKATASGTYSDAMSATPITSNEVISKRGAGNLEFTAPTTWDFGERAISDKEQEYSLAKLDEHILVTDNRAVGSKWKLDATLTSNFTLAGSGIEMPNVLKYKKGTNLSSLELNTPKEIVSAETTAGTRGKAVNVTENWVANKEGLVLVVPGSIVKKGTYEAAITWTVTDAP